MIRKLSFLISAVSYIILAQTGTEINKMFEQAVKDFNKARWASSLLNFNKIVNESELNSKTSISLLFIGKVNLELKNYIESEHYLLRLLSEFTESKFIDEAKMTLSKVYLDKKDYSKSFWQLCEIAGKSQNKETREIARISAENIAINYLSVAEINSIYDSTKILSIKPFLLLTTGKIYLAKNNYQLASETFAKILRIYPDSPEIEETRKLSAKTITPNESIDKPEIIGVILPLSPKASSLPVSEILEGIKYSLSEFNEGREKKIGILIRDSELKREKLIDIHSEFKEIQNLKCIIGPIFSSEVKDALEIFEDIDAPIISPTATDDYLTDSHQNFFQANPSFISRGRLMAQYIYFVANKRKIAILNAIDGYSTILSSSFAQEFEKLGGRIVSRESYKSRSVDLTEQMKKISESLNQIEGLYIPLADKIDIPVIVSFLSQTNLNVPIYGDQDWMSSSGMEAASVLDNNLIFCSDYFIRFDDPDYQNFSKNFFSKANMNANRNVLYGYDAMKYILTIMRASFATVSSIKQKMMSGIMVAGIHNNVCFDSSRINKYLNIVRYSNAKFELIDKFKLNN